MRDAQDEFVPNQDDAPAVAAQGDQKQEPAGWLRRTLSGIRDRRGLLAMNRDGKVVRVDRIDPVTE